MKIINRFIKDEKGQAIPLFALLAVVLFGFAALAMDWGMHYTTKSSYQKAADAAALAAAIDYPQRLTDLSQLTLDSQNNMRNVAVEIAKKNQKGITSEDVTVTFPALHKVQVEISLPFGSYLAGAAGFAKPEFTGPGDGDENDHVLAVAEKRTVWDGFALPFININAPVTIDGGINLRNHDTDTSSWREWLDGSKTGEDFEDYKDKSGTLPIEQMRINPYDGLYVRGGNKNDYNVQITQPIMDGYEGQYFVFSINPIIISTISTRGIAILDDGGKNYIPVNQDSSYLVAPYAKLVDDKYVPWIEGVDPIGTRVEQIVLLKVEGDTMSKGGNGEFKGTVIGQFSIDKELETEVGRNKSRLVK